MGMESSLLDGTPKFAFNIWDMNSAKAVIDAAREQKRAIILQTSENIYQQIPKKQVREFITGYSEDQQVRVWLQLDHCRDMGVLMDAVDHGWDIVMIDASDREIGENIRITNQAAEYAHARGALAEAEVGQVRGAEDDIRSLVNQVAAKEDIDRFVEEAHMDLIAVAFGNLHGIYKGEPKLHYDLIDYTSARTAKPFVVHGGSGLPDEALRRLLRIKNVKKINISTDVKLAYRRGILKAREAGRLGADGFQPVIVERYIGDEIKGLVKRKLGLLSD